MIRVQILMAGSVDMMADYTSLLVLCKSHLTLALVQLAVRTLLTQRDFADANLHDATRSVDVSFPSWYYLL